MLTRSTQLGESDLIAIATTRSQAHLLAISGRSDLSDEVTDVLIDCGDRDVARNLVVNRGARLSPAGLRALAARAAHDPILAGKLAQRSDVPADLVASACDEVADAAEEAEAWREVRALKRAGRLTEAEVIDFAERGRMRQTHVALALICDVSTDVVRGLIGGDQPEAALILCQAAGMSWPAACAVVAAVRAATHPAADNVFDDYVPISPATAAHFVDFLGSTGEMSAAG